MNISGKQVLITGGARRIGAAIARKLAACGCRIALHCHKSVAEAEILLASLPGDGHTLHVADLMSVDATATLCATVGKCELLVNNAALFYRPGSAEDLNSAAAYERVNFRAPEQILQWFSGQNLSCGAAVNITDCSALSPGSGAYYESKAALTALTTALAVPWAEKNLRLNAIAPGAVLPPAWAPESAMTKILAATPLHRATTPEEIAELTAFMLQCDSMTGAIVPLDGGLHLS
ncbi:MAG: SDR family oxidoreductase [Lentisphaerae bacterium]|nr:SDR family oxidoreductase [Lentisphaerota bacterium]